MKLVKLWWINVGTWPLLSARGYSSNVVTTSPASIVFYENTREFLCV